MGLRSVSNEAVNILGSGGNKVMPVDISQGMYDPFCYFFFQNFFGSCVESAVDLETILAH